MVHKIYKSGTSTAQEARRRTLWREMGDGIDWLSSGLRLSQPFFWAPTKEQPISSLERSNCDGGDEESIVRSALRGGADSGCRGVVLEECNSGGAATVRSSGRGPERDPLTKSRTEAREACGELCGDGGGGGETGRKSRGDEGGKPLPTPGGV